LAIARSCKLRRLKNAPRFECVPEALNGHVDGFPAVSDQKGAEACANLDSLHQSGRAQRDAA
jgi:hypothetical protein